MLQSNIQTYIEKEMNVQGQSLSLYQEEKGICVAKRVSIAKPDDRRKRGIFYVLKILISKE